MGGPIELIVVGSINRDTVLGVDRLPLVGETTIATSSAVGMGGKGANQAAAAAALGTKVAFVGRVGMDEAGALADRTFRTLGIDRGEITVDPVASTGSALVAVSSAGENMILVDPGANFTVAVSDVRDALRSLAVAGALTVLAQGELRGNIVDATAAETKALGLRFILNLAPHIEVAPETLQSSDPLVLNEGEATQLLAGLLGSPIARAPEDVALALGQHLGVPLVVTVGERGAIVVAGGQCWMQPSPKSPHVVDTTGAGDAFVGALASSLSEGNSMEAAVRVAVTAGSYAVGFAGAASSSLNRETLDTLIRQTPLRTRLSQKGDLTW